MGCVASKLDEEDDVVSLCRERKRLLKSAVERRYSLAEAHCKYTHSLWLVAAAIRLFVARHSSPASPFLITFPPPCPVSPPSDKVISNPMFLQQTPSESTKEAIDCHSSDSSISTDSSDDGGRVEREAEVEEEAPLCGYFFTEMPPPMPSPQRNFGWDFFNPFEGVRTEVMMSGCDFSRNSDEDLKAVREQEGIPELEEEDERERDGTKVVLVAEGGNEGYEVDSGVEVLKVVGGAASVSQGEQKGLTVVDTPARGRELLEALKDVEDHFIRAYDSGKDVSRMLEANRFHLQSSLDEIKGGFFPLFSCPLSDSS